MAFNFNLNRRPLRGGPGFLAAGEAIGHSDGGAYGWMDMHVRLMYGLLLCTCCGRLSIYVCVRLAKLCVKSVCVCVFVESDCVSVYA